jgi:hypothetical protein
MTPVRPPRRIPTGAIAIVVVLGILVLLALVAIWYGQRQANAPQPEPSARTAVIERTSLTAGMVLTGTLGYSDPVELGGGGGVVTKVPEAGAIVEAGQVLMEVDGRPVFLVQGAIPLWREVKPESIGPDVASLRGALTALGIDAGTPGDTRYDGALSAGIADLYIRAGYDPPAALAATNEDYKTASEVVKQAERSYEDAQLALEEAESAKPTDVQIMSANNAVESARKAVQAARTGDSGAAIAAATESLTLAKMQRDELLAPKDVSMETQAVTDAQAAVTRAQGDLAALPAGDAEARKAAEEAVSVAQLSLGSAQRALSQASAGPSELERTQADVSVAQAERTLEEAQKGDLGEALRQAKEQLKLVLAERKALNEPPDTKAPVEAVARTREDLDAARAALEQAGLNSVSPRDVLVVPNDTIRVDQVKAQLGLPADGAVITWTETVLYGRANLTEAQRARISTGAPVTVTLPSGTEIAGLVGDITNASTNPQTFEMVPAEARIDIADQAALADIGLATITISLVENEAEDTLVVPVTALLALAEGGYAVELPDGTYVGVEVGLIADTRAEIHSPNLTEGQEVVIP